ncbi:YveK family protein [Secundilactobacillus muriivasis]
MDTTLDLRQMFGILRKHIWFIIISTIGFAIIAFGVAEFAMTPKYTATTQILVNKKTSNEGLEYQNQQADVQMISTYKDIITNQVVLKQVKHNLAHPEKVVRKATKAVYRTNALTGKKQLVRAARPAVIKTTGKAYKITVEDLQNAISVSNQQNSQVFALAVESTNPEEAAAIANQVAYVFKSKIKSMMSVNNVTIVSKAVADNQKTSPNTKLITLAGLVLGILIGMGYAFIKELTDTTVKDDEFLTTLGLTNLGHIATIKMRSTKLAVKPSSQQSSNRNKRVRV